MKSTRDGRLLVLSILCAIVGTGCTALSVAPSSSLTMEKASQLASFFAVVSEPGETRAVSHVTPTGSMRPYLDERSVLLVEKPTSPILVGDVVIINEGAGFENIGHRVLEIRDGKVLVKGDHNEKPDGWFPIGNIVWRVAGVFYTRR